MTVSHVMKNPPHPGAVVLHECVEPLGLSESRFQAAQSAVSPTMVRTLVKRKAAQSIREQWSTRAANHGHSGGQPWSFCWRLLPPKARSAVSGYVGPSSALQPGMAVGRPISAGFGRLGEFSGSDPKTAERFVPGGNRVPAATSHGQFGPEPWSNLASSHSQCAGSHGHSVGGRPTAADAGGSAKLPETAERRKDQRCKATSKTGPPPRVRQLHGQGRESWRGCADRGERAGW